MHSSAVDGEGLAHGALEMEPLHVVPVLLEQRDKEVDGHEGILPELIGVHAHIADGHAHAKHLLQLELHLTPDVVDLVLKIVGVLHQGGEFTSLVEARPKETRDLRHEHLRSQEGVELLSLASAIC